MKSVAIITRTKNRPPMLRRALSDISKQTFKDFVWVVVNDGVPAPVEVIVREGREEGIDIVSIHNPTPTGIGASTNAGIRRSKSEFIVLHDDDDTWEPRFLEKTVDFLRSKSGARYGGVVTQSIEVLEKMIGETCSTVSTRPYNSDVRSVRISRICQTNRIPPISFLYRREFFDKVNGYPEGLAGLEDWAFNLKFLLHGDIGFVPEPLANYHYRVNMKGNEYMNASNRSQAIYATESIIRNRFLREDLQDGKTGLGFLVYWGRGIEDILEGLDRLVKFYSIGGFIRRKLGLENIR